MKPISYKGQTTINKTSNNETLLQKRNYSSTEMKKMEIMQKNFLHNKNFCQQLGIINGIGIKQIQKYKQSFFMNDKTVHILTPIRKVQKKVIDGQKFMQVVRLKPKIKEKEKSKIFQDVKKQQSTKEVQNDEGQENTNYNSKKVGIKKKVIERLSTLPKLQNPSIPILSFRKPLLTNLDANLKKIKSQHYYILQHQTQQPIIANRSKSKIQVASLTKIMTFYVCIQISEQFNLELNRCKIRIDQDIQGFCGTSALLQEGQIYTIQQLLYGLMLPSGNDAAMALAKWGGSLLRDDESEPKVKRFILRMNQEAKKLQLKDTKYGNPHGLPHKNAQTTCQDVAKLCSVCLKIPFFLKVVGTKIYKFRLEHEKYKRKLIKQWQNTHKLLRRNGFIGIKTGITVTAGPCLASAYRFRDKTYIVIIAKCNKSSRRFKETRKLLVHCLQRMEFKQELTAEERAQLKALSRSNEDLDSDYSDEEKQFDFKKFNSDEMNRRARIITTHI